MEVKLIQNEMAFQPFPFNSSFDQVFSGSYDERFHRLQYPLEYRRNFCTYPPNLNSALSQNIDCHISSRNVASSSFFGEPCYQLPYANHTLVPNRFQSDACASVSNFETYVTTPPYNSNRFVNNSVYDCYNVRRGLTLPYPAYPSFSDHIDRECLASYSANLNQQSADDFCTLNSSSMMVSWPQMQHYQQPACLTQEVANSGRNHCSAVPQHYSVDEILHNTVISSAHLRGESRSVFGMQASLLDRDNTLRTSFCNYSQPTQLQVLDQNFEFDDKIDTFSESSTIDYSADDACVNTSVALSRQGVTDISTVLGSERMLTDCAMDDCRRSRHADYMASSLCLNLSVSEAHVSSEVHKMSSTADDFLCQAMPEMPRPTEGQVTFASSMNASDEYSIRAESTCCGSVSVQRSPSPMQTTMGVSGASDSTSEYEIPTEEDEQISVNSIQTDTFGATFSDAFTTNVPDVSDTMQFLAESNKNSQVISPMQSAFPSELNVASRQELVPEAMEIAEPYPNTENCRSVDILSNSSDDVIVLSPLPVACEPAALVSMDPKTVPVKSCPQMQPMLHGQQNTADHLFSAVHPTVLLAVRHHISSHAVGDAHCQSSQLVPMTSHDFVQSRNHYMLRSHAKQISNNCSIQATNCQRRLPNSVVSCIPTTSHMIHCLPNVAACNYVKPMVRHSPITVTCDSVQKGQGHSTQMQRERQLHCTPSDMQAELLKSRTCNLTVVNTDHCYAMKRPQHSRLQKPMPVTLQAFPQCAVAQRRASQSINSISSSQISHISSAVRQNHCPYYKPLFTVCGRGSSTFLLQHASMRKHGTYSIRAASAVLQQLRQGRLLDFVHATRQQQLYNRRHRSLLRTGVPQSSDVIDLTDDSEENAVETCEDIFAWTRHRLASIRSLHRSRQYFVRRSNVADGSCSSNPKHQREKKAFAVDRSLPFYRCFVQKLLRNFKFSSGGAPAKIWPAFPDIMRPSLPSSAAAANEAYKTGHSSVYKELVKNRQPVVVLKKLDQSILNKYSSITVETLQSDVGALDTSRGIECENCALSASGDASEILPSCESHNNGSLHTSQSVVDTKSDQTKEETDQKETVVPKVAAVGWQFEHKGNVRDSWNGVDAYHRQEIAESDRTEAQNIQQENVAVKHVANGRQQQYDKLDSLCRPVSVVLERLDKTKVYHSCRDLGETRTCHQDGKQTAPLETELSVGSHNWTAVQVPRANKLPILVIRALPSSTLNTSQNKVAEKAYEYRSRYPQRCTSNYLRQRVCAVDIQRLRNFGSHCSKLDTSRKKILKKMLRTRKPSSLSMSLRSSHFLRSCHILMPAMRPACRISSKCNQNRTKLLSKLFVKRARRGKHIHSKLTDGFCKPESSVTSVDQDSRSVLSDSTSKNDLQANLLPYDSDSNTVELSPQMTSVDHDICFTPSNLAQNSALSDDLLTCDSFYRKELSNDCESSDSDTIVSSSAGIINSVDQDMSFSLTSKNALTTDLLTYHSVCKEDLQDCVSSDSDTVILSRQSSMDDLTIAYRSPLCDVFDSDELSEDQHVRLDENSEAGVSGRRPDLITVNSDSELKPPSSSDLVVSAYSGVISEPFSNNLVESCTFSESLDCGLSMSNVVYDGRAQPAPVQLIDSANTEPEAQHSVNNSPSEFLDSDQKKHVMAASVSVEVVMDNSSNGLEEG